MVLDNDEAELLFYHCEILVKLLKTGRMIIYSCQNDAFQFINALDLQKSPDLVIVGFHRSNLNLLQLIKNQEYPFCTLIFLK